MTKITRIASKCIQFHFVLKKLYFKNNIKVLHLWSIARVEQNFKSH